MTNNAPTWLSPNQAALRAGCGRDMIMYWGTIGLPIVKRPCPGGGHRFGIELAELLRFLKEHEVNAAPEPVRDEIIWKGKS